MVGMSSMRQNFLITLLVGCTLSGSASTIIRCEMNGKSVNPNNGSETANLAGMLRRKDEDPSKLQREQALRDGK